jgi:hypothetical protein
MSGGKQKFLRGLRVTRRAPELLAEQTSLPERRTHTSLEKRSVVSA